MSADRYTHYWHLTPDGWVEGAVGQYLSDEQSKEKTPKNRLLTLEYEERQSSQYSPPDHSLRVTVITGWRYADVVRAILTYGLYPDHGAGLEEKEAANLNKFMSKSYRQDMELDYLISRCSLNVKEQKRRASSARNNTATEKGNNAHTAIR